VIFNRQGECVEISTTRDDVESQDDDSLEEDGIIEEKETTQLPVKPLNSDKIGQMASDIADMISEINQGDE